MVIFDISTLMEDETYYRELQASLRSYDQKLWIIPGLFFVIIGFIVNHINFDANDIFSLKNTIVSFLGSASLLIIIFLYNKAHIFLVLIQKKVNEFDNDFNSGDAGKNNLIERIPLVSMENQELDKIINKLESKNLKDSKNHEGASFSCTQKSFARLRVSFWIRNTMISLFTLTSLFFIVCFMFNLFSIFGIFNK